MFKDKQTSKAVLAALDSCSKQLDASLFIAKDGDCDKESYESYKKLVGFAMGYIYTDLIRPIHVEHPELEPDGLKHADK